jgi:hypothetical protein
MDKTRAIFFTPFTDFCTLVILFAVITFCYAEFDPRDMLNAGIFPWDSSIYRSLAEQINVHGLNKLEGVYPYATRIVFPALYGYIAHTFNLSYVLSTYYLNLLSSFWVYYFILYYLKCNGISWSLRWSATVIYMLFWLGPLRYSGFYPGGGFAFESLAVCLLFLVLERTRDSHCVTMVPGIILVFFLSVAREFCLYILLLLSFSYLISYFVWRIVPKPSGLLGFFHDSFDHSVYLSRVFPLTIAALVGYLSTRILVKGTGDSYSVALTVLQFGWFHLHPGEVLYVFFYALGPFFLCFLLAMSFGSFRQSLKERVLANTPEFGLLIVFVISSVIFSLVGGTDSDRFLLWFFPFFALIGMQSLQVMQAHAIKHRTVLMFTVGTCAILWTRFYVPAVPHTFFPGDLYNSSAGVRSNLNPSLFYGPKFMEQLRLPLKLVDFTDAYSEKAASIDNPSKLFNPPPEISVGIERNNGKGSPFKGSYRYEVNNIPIPLGFAHNQYELLVAHPYHGDPRVRLLLLTQWIAVSFGLWLLITVGIRSDFTSRQSEYSDYLSRDV